MKKIMGLTLIMLMISCDSKVEQEKTTIFGNQSNNNSSNTKIDVKFM